MHRSANGGISGCLTALLSDFDSSRPIISVHARICHGLPRRGVIYRRLRGETRFAPASLPLPYCLIPCPVAFAATLACCELSIPLVYCLPFIPGLTSRTTQRGVTLSLSLLSASRCVRTCISAFTCSQHRPPPELRESMIDSALPLLQRRRPASPAPPHLPHPESSSFTGDRTSRWENASSALLGCTRI